MRRPKKTVTINLGDYLSAGTYNVKVKSKGTDIRDSAESNSVSCEVSGSLSDLTGTTWLLNRYPDIESFGNTFGTDVDININFTSNLQNFTAMWYYYDSAEDDSDFRYGYPMVSFYSNTNYRTIYITGGTDATNQTLIAWLKANAIQQEVYNGGGGGASD